MKPGFYITSLTVDGSDIQLPKEVKFEDKNGETFISHPIPGNVFMRVTIDLQGAGDFSEFVCSENKQENVERLVRGILTKKIKLIRKWKFK